MRLAFVSFSGWLPSPAAPRQVPLGGSHSALCYLATEMARLGHDVTWMTSGARVGHEAGITCLPLNDDTLPALAEMTAVVVLNLSARDPVARLVEATGDGPLRVLWTQHADDQPAVRDLGLPEVQAAWHAIAVVSAWQRTRYADAFGIAPARMTVMPNGVAPAFAALCAPGAARRDAGPAAPVLAYTSTPFRGLDVLLHAFPQIRAAFPEARLKVFSSLAVYQVPAEQDQFGFLYDLCRSTPGVDYVGSLAQPVLARAMQEVTCLAYPNTFPETSCIAALEAMAAGCLVVTSRLGALPETTAGFAELVEPVADRAAFATAFAERTIAALAERSRQPEAWAARRDRQIAHIRDHHTWPVLARRWSAWLEALAAARNGTP